MGIFWKLVITWERRNWLSFSILRTEVSIAPKKHVISEICLMFLKKQMLVIGISSQSVESHKEFAEVNRLKYTLLSDCDNVVRKLFGVPGWMFGLIPGRVTYVADRSGKVVYIFDSQTKIQRHADEAMKICLLLKKTDNGRN
ncbi:MAG: redoxin domain-containing protein [Bacteroidales bacterium]|nr:redoxin domain-containing protein [Bacteroidales bacterium]